MINLLLVLLMGQTGPCGQSTGPLLPDLTVNVQVLRSSSHKQVRHLDGCDVSEGYVDVAGDYPVISFTTQTENHGLVDLVLGYPSQCPLFEPSPCYNWRAVNSTEFRWWTQPGYDNWLKNRDMSLSTSGTINQTLLEAAKANGELIATGFKKWFCLEDEYPVKTGDHAIAKYDCNYQGLQPSFVDVYDYSLAGQYIILKNVPKGKYVLEVHIDPHCVLPDSTRQNNSVGVVVQWPGS